jgi:hypothetical protein
VSARKAAESPKIGSGARAGRTSNTRKYLIITIEKRIMPFLMVNALNLGCLI